MKHNSRPMPKIDLQAANLNAEDYELAARIVNSRTGELRASKPPVPRKIEVANTSKDNTFFPTRFVFANAEDEKAGCAAYVWRNVAFYVSPLPVHHCMPCTDTFDLPYYMGDPEYKPLVERLNAIVDKITNTVPKAQWYGVMRWKNAFGM